MLVQLRPKTEVSILAIIPKTYRLDNFSPKVVWHKEEVELLHKLSMVETTLVDILMARQVA